MRKDNGRKKELEEVNNKDLDDETLFVVSQTFKALGDPTRIRILHLLFYKEYSVNGIAETLHLRQSTVSHQLRFLKNLRLVKFEGKAQHCFIPMMMNIL